MSRTAQYMQGRREALKWAITFLHAKAEGMNDYSAKAALNVAATDIGDYTRNGNLPHVKRLFRAPSHLEQAPKESVSNWRDFANRHGQFPDSDLWPYYYRDSKPTWRDRLLFWWTKRV